MRTEPRFTHDVDLGGRGEDPDGQGPLDMVVDAIIKAITGGFTDMIGAITKVTGR